MASDLLSLLERTVRPRGRRPSIGLQHTPWTLGGGGCGPRCLVFSLLLVARLLGHLGRPRGPTPCAGGGQGRSGRSVLEEASLTCACTRVSPQMNDNLLESWSDLDELKGAKGLETVYLERNPLQKDPQYRRKVMLALPSVRQIDATYVRF